MLWNSISAVLTAFVFLAIGFLITRAGWITKYNKNLLTMLVMYIAVPCTIFKNVLDTVSPDNISSIWGYILVPALSILTVFFLSGILARHVLKVQKGRLGAFSCMCSCSNTIFVGLPIVLSAIGDVSVPYVMYYLMAQNVIFWSLGLIGIQRDGQGDIHFSFGDMVKKVLSINIVVIFISLLLVALRVTVPVFFMDIAGKLGNTCTPLSLIFCGATMYEVFQNHGLRGLAIPRDTLYVFISRFVICPLLMFGICTLFGIGGIARTVFVIISAMPTQSQTVIMSSRYGADVDFASITFFWTTLACFVVIPILLTIVAG